MEESWVFEPAEPGFSSDHVDSGLAHAFENTSIPCVASSSDSEDGVWVEKPSVVDDYVHKQSESPPVQVTQTPAVIKRHTRSRLSPERRLQAASTRKWGACIRCYIQKIRCIPHPENPENSCCLTCASVSRESKKVIHRLPCLRLRLTEVVMFRGGGLNLTSRWTGTAMKNLSPNDWVNNELRTLTWQLEHSPYPLQFTVKRFHPQAGDSLSRKWQDSNGQTRETRIEPFGLADIQKTANDYMAYNFTYSLASLNTVKQRMIGQVEDIVWRTYDEVSKLIVMTERPPGLRGKNVNPADFLHQYVKLWFGIRNSVGSAYITENTDTLDMGPESHPDYPYGARISIPRMVSEQFYNLQYERLLVPTRKRVLEDLNRMMTGKKPDHFFTVYLTVFMLLYETSVASADRHRRAAQYAEPTYYSLPLFVEQLQFGANIVLLHWHYYKRGFNPLRTDWSSVKDKAIWSTLTMEQRQFLCDSWRYFEDRAARPVEKMTWKNELYFVAQMFEDDLSLGETYPGN
ncbi:hypothetical protein Micbo1qcDRAFT_160243 [Microdochium bolleyi]|uniref:Zn(2)-C6 fungal-type domain-containing protein n=1 Tax=Microdochium bolleyi TaxID=196109 RepID=A0A136J5N1_9PEZI|nr:hypothetical protein Micbo1qcDRAFT_160243 [Microdochium bolleyi]